MIPASTNERLVAASYYLGLGPIVEWRRRPSVRPLVVHHRGYAMAALFCVGALFLVACVIDSAECVLFVRFPAFGDRLVTRFGFFLGPVFEWGAWVVLALVACGWLVLLIFALAGSARSVPLLKRLSARGWVVGLSLLLNRLMFVAAPLGALCAIHASSLTQRCGSDAAIYFLYDEGIGVPRWAFALGLYRISCQGQRNWGHQSVALDTLTMEHLSTAFANGKVVILATHGENGCAVTYYAPQIIGVFPPPLGVRDADGKSRFIYVSKLSANQKWGEKQVLPVNGGLQLAYIFACNGGAKAAEWREHLFPAEVVAYDRFSTVWDHAFWFALTGPARLKEWQHPN